MAGSVFQSNQNLREASFGNPYSEMAFKYVNKAFDNFNNASSTKQRQDVANRNYGQEIKEYNFKVADKERTQALNKRKYELDKAVQEGRLSLNEAKLEYSKLHDADLLNVRSREFNSTDAYRNRQLDFRGAELNANNLYRNRQLDFRSDELSSTNAYRNGQLAISGQRLNNEYEYKKGLLGIRKSEAKTKSKYYDTLISKNGNSKEDKKLLTYANVLAGNSSKEELNNGYLKASKSGDIEEAKKYKFAMRIKDMNHGNEVMDKKYNKIKIFNESTLDAYKNKIEDPIYEPLRQNIKSNDNSVTPTTPRYLW